MLPPESSAQTSPEPPALPASSAASRRGARPFHDELRALEQEHDRLGDLFVLDMDDVVEQLVEDRHRQHARMLHGDAVGNRARPGLPRLHADEAHGRKERAERDRDPRGEPAAPDRHENRLDIRKLLCELEADRPLTCDHHLVLEGMHERRAGLRGTLECLLERLVEARTGEHGLRTVVARRVDLRHRRVLGHEHGCPDSELAGRPRDRLPVVAGARRDHAARPLVVSERRELVDRAAHLERAGALQVLRPQPHGSAAPPGERLRAVDRRHERMTRDALARSFDVSECRSGQARQCGTPSRGSLELR